MEPTQQPIQSQPDVFTPQPKLNYLKTIIFSVLGVLLVVSITYLYLQNQSLKKQVLNQQVAPTIQAPSPTLTLKTVTSISIQPNETAGWKTYIDSNNGFSFSYPPDWKIEEKPLVLSDMKGHKISINVWQVTGFGYCYKYGSDREIMVGGKTAKTADGIGTGSTELCDTPKEDMEKLGNTFILIPLKDDGIVSMEKIHISYDYPLSDLNLAQTKLNQILSTFKFTDNTSVCVPTYQVETNSVELTAEQNYSVRCTEQRSEKDCLSIDLYNQKAGDFSVPDQISDCIWKNPTI
ncbi:conserved hypothetical protein [Candidatus Roizmanbacteria bacterium]|nr:conserved hypothetical protein [Candidatus Roizmanbacteria bacterium]